MSGFAESEGEQAALGWLGELGWSVLYGPDIGTIEDLIAELKAGRFQAVGISTVAAS